ncbi:cytochrome P450 [Streptomyces lanatus]|uniref:Cytochrome P450 n=1 Tax=Streptomyces lanatus TaxID=66900 RepID=A0ABV1XXJ7_9ACTN|nr:cytochrome P450 [Streptomyces lanatus]GHH17308.1 cytochrome P450 [Streptomyces lanatus]
MASPVDDWDVHPGHFWLRGKRPENLVSYDEEIKMWNIYGYPECAEALSNTKVFSSDMMRLEPIQVDYALVDGDFGHTDPPKHRKLRGLVDHAFKPALLGRLESEVHGIIHELLDQVDGKPSFDLMKEFAAPLPLIVIADLMGVPPSDRGILRGWMDKMLQGGEELKSPEEQLEEKEQLEKELELLWEMRDYWKDMAVERRKKPRGDLVSELLDAEIDGQRLTDSQIANICNRMMVNGHLTTAMLIGNTMLCLDAYPEEGAKVRADRSLLPSAIEESLRFLSPICGVGRATNADVEIGGTTIPKDQLLIVWTGSANRDERQFQDPHTFIADRTPNNHIGLGRGVHFCIGRQLARMEAKAAVEVLLDRFPGMRPDPAAPPTFLQVIDVDGVETLPVLTG